VTAVVDGVRRVYTPRGVSGHESDFPLPATVDELVVVLFFLFFEVVGGVVCQGKAGG